MADPRQVLGVDRYATLAECRKAYRALAKKHHPDVDKTPGATARMAAITAAWALVQKLPQPTKPQDHQFDGMRGPLGGSVRQGRGSPSRPYAGASEDELNAAFEEAVRNAQRAAGGRGWSSNTSTSGSFGGNFGFRYAGPFYEGPIYRGRPSGHDPAYMYADDITGEDLKRTAEDLRRTGYAEMPTWPDGSIKVTAADFTGDPCDFRMPGGLFEGNKLGDILRDHEWYGDEIDQYPIGDPIRGLFRQAKTHLERERKGRPIHEW